MICVIALCSTWQPSLLQCQAMEIFTVCHVVLEPTKLKRVSAEELRKHWLYQIQNMNSTFIWLIILESLSFKPTK